MDHSRQSLIKLVKKHSEWSGGGCIVLILALSIFSYKIDTATGIEPWQLRRYLAMSMIFIFCTIYFYIRWQDAEKEAERLRKGK